MSRVIFSLTLAGLLALSTAVVADETKELTQVDYQAAIEKFGVDEATAKVAAEKAFIATKSDQVAEKNDIMVRLPADFLEGAPY